MDRTDSQSLPRPAKRGVLERELAGTRPGNPRYQVLKAHYEFLSGAEDRAAHDFRKYLAEAGHQLSSIRSLMNDVIEAAFCIGDLNSLEELLTRTHGCILHLSTDRSQETDNPSVVLWSLGTNGSSTYHFSPRVIDHPYSGVLLKHWIQELPLLTQFQRANPRAVSHVWLNVADAGSIPGLAYCDYRQGFYLLPDPIFMQTRAYAEAKATSEAGATPWTSRKPIAFWRGQTTGWYTAQGAPVRSWEDLPRVQLCRLAQIDAARGWLDAGLTGLAQITKQEDREAIESAGLRRGYVHWSKFHQWKYQVDIDGNTNAWPGLFIKLCSGSPILKVKSPRGFRQWYYDRLIPWENYVPVEADMSDLLDKITWLRNHDEDAWRIGENARRLAVSMSEDGEIARALPSIGKAFALNGESGRLRGLNGRAPSLYASQAADSPADESNERQDPEVRTFLGLDATVPEREAFRARVLQLNVRDQPVKLHLGPGESPKEGFINVDKFKNAQARDFFVHNPQDYIVYPFAEYPWPIPDCSVDYIYHEDFIEHIPQKNQFLLLAEALRVLKPGAIHRISTPCLIESMRHSDFTRGFAGVYVFEWERWGHVALLSRASLEEMARLVGYRYVYFTAKTKSMSPFATEDSRPHGDRDPVLGNIFADLLK